MSTLDGKSELLGFCQGDVDGCKRYNIHINGRVKQYAIKWRMPFVWFQGEEGRFIKPSRKKKHQSKDKIFLWVLNLPASQCA